MAEYSEVHKKVVEGDLEPGVLIIEDKLVSIHLVPYNLLVQEFERLGAFRITSRAS